MRKWGRGRTSVVGIGVPEQSQWLTPEGRTSVNRAAEALQFRDEAKVARLW